MKNRFFVLVIILMSIPTVIWLFQPGFFQSDDGEWMIIRFSAFHQALADGQFPVRWLGRLNHEYGYPVANFLYPGFMYLAEPIHLLGFGFVDSIKIVLGLSMVGSAIFCYLWLATLFDRSAALVGAMFYLYMPYHLYDLYKRGSVGEVLALAVLPFIFWMIEKRNFFFVSLGIAMLVLSHNTLAALFLPAVVVYMLIRSKSSIRNLTSSIILGLGISTFFWIPALFDLQYTRFSQTAVSNWQDHFASFDVVGIGSFVILTVAVVGLILKRAMDNVAKLFLFVGLLSIFLSLSLSSFVWNLLPVSFIQFPFRFLSLTLPAVAFLSAWSISNLKGQQKLFGGILLFLFLAISSLPFLRPALFFDKGDSYYATNEDTTNVQNEYMPKWVRDIPQERATKKVEVLNNAGGIDAVILKNNKVTFTVVMESEGIIRINTVYFPGWKALVDGSETEIVSDNDRGLMEIAMPIGRHNVVVAFGETPIRLVSDIISIGTLVGLLFWRRKLSI